MHCTYIPWSFNFLLFVLVHYFFVVVIIYMAMNFAHGVVE